MHAPRPRHTAATALQRSYHDLRVTQLLLDDAEIRSTAKSAQLDTTDSSRRSAELHGNGEHFPSRHRALRGKMEAAGIEPASAAAPVRASTSFSRDSLSPGGRLAGGLPTD